MIRWEVTAHLNDEAKTPIIVVVLGNFPSMKKEVEHIMTHGVFETHENSTTVTFYPPHRIYRVTTRPLDDE